MKYINLALGLTLLYTGVWSQTSVPKVPVYEVFSSSTCGPCKPANDYLSPIFEDNRDQIVVVKYQMSWPGTGDPYYTSEGNQRRTLYGVNAIPDFYRNATKQSYSSFNQGSIDTDKSQQAYMRMYLRYLINPDSQSIAIRARVEVLANYNAGAQRLLIPIIERETYNNKKSNGETVFHNVFKKMLPESSGQIIIGHLDSGTVIDFDSNYIFQGNYRLPSSALDPIDNNSENSVEDFDSLHVVMFMQSLESTKEIFQGVSGERCYSYENLNREWGTNPIPPLSVKELKNEELIVFPNPTSQFVSIHFHQINEVVLMDISGKILNKFYPDSSVDNFTIDISRFSSGIYLLKVSGIDKSIVTKIVLQ